MNPLCLLCVYYVYIILFRLDVVVFGVLLQILQQVGVDAFGGFLSVGVAVSVHPCVVRRQIIGDVVRVAFGLGRLLHVFGHEVVPGNGDGAAAHHQLQNYFPLLRPREGKVQFAAVRQTKSERRELVTKLLPVVIVIVVVFVVIVVVVVVIIIVVVVKTMTI
jgi:hypothetical protein